MQKEESQGHIFRDTKNKVMTNMETNRRPTERHEINEPERIRTRHVKRGDILYAQDLKEPCSRFMKA